MDRVAKRVSEFWLQVVDSNLQTLNSCSLVELRTKTDAAEGGPVNVRWYLEVPVTRSSHKQLYFKEWPGRNQSISRSFALDQWKNTHSGLSLNASIHIYHLFKQTQWQGACYPSKGKNLREIHASPTYPWIQCLPPQQRNIRTYQGHHPCQPHQQGLKGVVSVMRRLWAVLLFLQTPWNAQLGI